MRKLVVIGASHAKRLANLFRSNKHFRKFFEIHDFSKPGTTCENTLLPNLNNYSSNDVLILSLFGNDLMKKNIFIEKKDKTKIFHLTKYEPSSIESLREKFLKIKEYLATCNMKCYIIDNVLRHLFCCRKHRFPGLRQFQNLVNKELHIFFNNTNVTVLSHLKLMKFPENWKNSKKYVRFLEDKVHLKRRYYSKMVDGIWKIICQTETKEKSQVP